MRPGGRADGAAWWSMPSRGVPRGRGPGSDASGRGWGWRGSRRPRAVDMAAIVPEPAAAGGGARAGAVAHGPRGQNARAVGHATA